MFSQKGRQKCESCPTPTICEDSTCNYGSEGVDATSAVWFSISCNICAVCGDYDVLGCVLQDGDLIHVRNFPTIHPHSPLCNVLAHLHRLVTDSRSHFPRQLVGEGFVLWSHGRHPLLSSGRGTELGCDSRHFWSSPVLPFQF